MSERSETQKVYIKQGYKFPKKAPNTYSVRSKNGLPVVENIVTRKKHKGLLGL